MLAAWWSSQTTLIWNQSRLSVCSVTSYCCSSGNRITVHGEFSLNCADDRIVWHLSIRRCSSWPEEEQSLLAFDELRFACYKGLDGANRAAFHYYVNGVITDAAIDYTCHLEGNLREDAGSVFVPIAAESLDFSVHDCCGQQVF